VKLASLSGSSIASWISTLKPYATTSSYTVLQKLINMHMTFDLST